MAEGSVSGAMYYDVEKLTELSQFFADKKTSLDTLKEELGTLVSDLSSSWKGEAYDSFKTMYDAFDKDSFDPIVKEMETWSSKFADLASSATDNTTANKAIFE